MKIYVVIGSSGENTSEYSDFHEWNLCGYKDENKAISRVNELNELIALHYDKRRHSYREIQNIRKIVREHPRGDKYFDIDYPGTSYSYYELQIED